MLRFTKRIISRRIIASGVAMLVSVTVVSACMFFRNRYIDRKLSGTATLNQEWLELTSEESLKVERDTQEITLYPDPPIKMVFGDGKLVPIDGRSATIEAELIDGKGVTYHSSSGVSETMTGDLKVTSRSVKFKDLPRDAVFKTVRIKSSASYPVRKILWRCYNWAEAHN